MARFADPAIRIVTVTGSACCLDPATGGLDARHRDVRGDLRRGVPRSALGVPVRGLAAIGKAGRRPPVVLSCDNLPMNGRVLRRVLMEFAALHDDALADWIGSSVQFPCSMVDRIVPVAEDADAADATLMLGLTDEAPVCTEPFRQWTVEAFDGPRPLWEAGGAAFVPDVAPREGSKLRLLNGTHMAIAYLGALAGLHTVADVVEEPLFAAYALRFMLEEQMPTLPPSGHDLRAYAHQLLERWRNPGIAHQLGRVGRNGSEKLQARLLASIRDNLEAGRPAPCTLLAVAAWICCQSGRSAVDMRNPLSARMKGRWAAAGNDPNRLAASVLAMEDVFGPELPRLEPFRTGLTQAIVRLHGRGPRAAVAALMAQPLAGTMRGSAA